MTTNRLGTPLSQPTDIPTAIPIGQPTTTDSVPRSDQASHGRTDGRTDEELGYLASESSRNASPAGGLEEIHHLPSETTEPRCQVPSCPDFGDPDFGEATCPSWHAEQPPSPVGSSGVSGPVDGRSVAEIRADLAHCDRDGTPWPQAARRLLADVPALLAEVEAAHRFEQSAAAESAGLANRLNEVAAERDALLAEAEGLRRELTAVGDALDDLTDSWHDLAAERDSLRGVVQAVRVLADEIEADPMKGMVAHVDEIRACLAAAADAPQPADHLTTQTLSEVLGLTPEQEAERVASLNADLDRIRAAERAVFHPGPSPAVLPQTETEKR